MRTLVLESCVDGTGDAVPMIEQSPGLQQLHFLHSVNSRRKSPL